MGVAAEIAEYVGRPFGTFERLVALQARLIRIAAQLVKPGGSLVYIVCSLVDAEGADQVMAFLREHPGWSAGGPAAVAGGSGCRRD